MKLILLTPGDPEGIGPEITQKVLARPRLPRDAAVICVGDVEALSRAGKRRFHVMPVPGSLTPAQAASRLVRRELVELARDAARTGRVAALAPTPDGRPPAARRCPGGWVSGWAVELSARLALGGCADALVTGPIHKERLRRGGYAFDGHTDLLAEVCGGADVTMMLAHGWLRVALVTTHVALAQVPRLITSDRIVGTVERTARALRDWYGVRRPRIAVAALNPHAGEGGLFGREDARVVAPAIARARARLKRLRIPADLVGPLASDGLFAAQGVAYRANGRLAYDAIVCMYHDQGLIPVKLTDFARATNLTLGLPILRVSVDHGTAFDIAGQGIADPSSLRAALDTALRFV